jgi:hypothetical protein
VKYVDGKRGMRGIMKSLQRREDEVYGYLVEGKDA